MLARLVRESLILRAHRRAWCASDMPKQRLRHWSQNKSMRQDPARWVINAQGPLAHLFSIQKTFHSNFAKYCVTSQKTKLYNPVDTASTDAFHMVAGTLSGPTGGVLAAILHCLNSLTSSSLKAPTTLCSTPWLLNSTKSPCCQSWAYTY